MAQIIWNFFVNFRLKNSNIFLSVHGSTIYGVDYKNNSQIVKPNSKSDVDLMVISENLQFIERLEDILDKDVLEFDLYKNSVIDMIVLRAKCNERKISIECVKIDKYFRICRALDPYIVVNKKLKSKKGKVGSFYDYDIFGFVNQEKSTSRIIPYNESHIIIYPNQSNLRDGSFALTVFQDQILTQVDLIGDLQEKGRKFLIDKVNIEAKKYKYKPLSLFRARSIYWSKDFLKYMEDRFNDG